jgi:hypothetical protein
MDSRLAPKGCSVLLEEAMPGTRSLTRQMQQRGDYFPGPQAK